MYFLQDNCKWSAKNIPKFLWRQRRITQPFPWRIPIWKSKSPGWIPRRKSKSSGRIPRWKSTSPGGIPGWKSTKRKFRGSFSPSENGPNGQSKSFCNQSKITKTNGKIKCRTAGGGGVATIRWRNSFITGDRRHWRFRFKN